MRNEFTRMSEKLATNVCCPEDEKLYLRDLATIVMDIAAEPRMDAIKQRWKDVNALRAPDRPPVWCNPVGCWSELLPDDDLVCLDSTGKNIEREFRKLIIKRDIDDDTPVNGYLKVPMIFDVTPENTWGVEILKESLDDSGSAWQYKSALETYEDFDKVKVPKYRYNRKATETAMSKLNDLLGDSTPLKLVPFSGYFSRATIAYAAADLRGMEQLMMDMILKPGRVHQLMEKITKGVMNFLDAVEEAGRIVPNIDDAMLLSDPIGTKTVDDDDASLLDCWMAGNSQELDQVSPEMFEEFLLNYQKTIFKRFGAVSYGCCENLTKKLDPVLEIPNLRIMVCSAWTNLDTLIEKVAGKHCVMWRHLASDVVCSDDTAGMKKKINSEASKLKGTPYQAILRELQTLMGHENRLDEWTDITKEAVSR